MGHTAVVYNNSMFVFGGYDNFGSGCNDLYQYIFKTNTWNKVKPTGVVPRAMYHHSAVVYQVDIFPFKEALPSKILFFYRGACTLLGELWVFMKYKSIDLELRHGHS